VEKRLFTAPVPLPVRPLPAPASVNAFTAASRRSLAPRRFSTDAVGGSCVARLSSWKADVAAGVPNSLPRREAADM
jgi:hypothetical protein